TDPGTFYLRVFNQNGYDQVMNYALDIEPTFIDDFFDIDGCSNNTPCEVTGAPLGLGTITDLIARDDDWYRSDVSGVDFVNVRADHRFFSGNLHLMIANGDVACEGALANLIGSGFSNNASNNFVEVLGINVQGIDTILVRVFGAIRDRNYYDLTVQE